MPAEVFFATPSLRKGPKAQNTVVYGAGHLFRAAWLSGAQEFLKDPWTADELFLRLRGPQSPRVSWNWGDSSLCLEGRLLATEQGAKVRLSATESALLRTLVQRRGAVVSRAVLSWAASCSEGRVIDTLVARIRSKIQMVTNAHEEPVLSVRGSGYRLP